MSKIDQPIPTQWGNAVIELLSCDNCGAQVQTPYAVNWLQLFRLTENKAKLMGQLPEETHFCGTPCLKEYLP